MSPYHHLNQELCLAKINCIIQTRFLIVFIYLLIYLTLSKIDRFLNLKVRYIYSVEGVTGLYRGLGMKLIGNAIGTAASDQISKVIQNKFSLVFGFAEI